MADLHHVDWSKLPVPEDDGAADHLEALILPALFLPSSAGEDVDLSTLPGRTVVYVYPMTGRPDAALPENWDMIPGARGCTPQACAFRDHFAELRRLGIDHLFGLSTQTPQDQKEASTRLHLPFALLSDEGLCLADALDLPRFEVGGRVFLKRLTMVICDGVVRHAIYPVFPPDQNASMLIEWLSETA